MELGKVFKNGKKSECVREKIQVLNEETDLTSTNGGVSGHGERERELTQNIPNK